jgi:hypothetical protein
MTMSSGDGLEALRTSGAADLEALRAWPRGQYDRATIPER